MSKVRVYELAKDYGMKGPALAKLLKDLGIEKIKSHMAVLDEADLMMVTAMLEANGLRRQPAGGGEASSGGTRTKPRKKSLPTPAGKAPAKKELPKKKLPGAPTKTGTGAVSDGDDGPAAGEAAAAEPAAEKQELPKKPLPGREPARGAPSGEATPRDAGDASPAQPAASTPQAREAAADTEAPADHARRPEPAAPEQPTASGSDAGQAPGDRPGAGDAVAEKAPPADRGSAATGGTAADAPAERGAGVARQPGPPSETPAETPAAEQGDRGEHGDTGAAGDAAKKSDDVKKLIVPKAKAQVLGRIELPRETIRDAKSRSAPGGSREASLRRRALQNTQSRSAGRGPGGPRRGPGGPMRGGPGGMRGRFGREGGARGGRRTKSKPGLSTTVDPNKVVELEPPVSMKGLSEALGVRVTDLIATLTFKLGVKGKTINSYLTEDEVELVALEIGRKIKLVEEKDSEEALLKDITSAQESHEEYQRAPVVTFMGHVDHGKTTLLDALRASDVTRGEAGGITQHIGAYKIKREDGTSFVVLDTPGHAAFTSMRARGANITDIVVLVVAADDGVMPQTEEAIDHAKAAGVPIIVAVNKCDAPGANPMQVRQQLSVKGLQPEEWGGDVQVVDVSALQGTGLDELVEKVHLEAELLELKARPSGPGVGVVVESKQTPEQGVIVNVLVTDGTLRVRDQVLCGTSLSRIRSMIDDRGKAIELAEPSTPVSLVGLNELPVPGDKLFVVTDARQAREVADERTRKARDRELAARSTGAAITLENLKEALDQKKVEEVKVILKADVMGSLEPIKQCLGELATDEVRVTIVRSALGGITETDVSLAEASDAILIGFNTVPDQAARIAADRANVEIRQYSVIYDLIDDMKKAMEGMLAPEEVESVIGHAEVRATFRSSKFGTIAGLYVLDGVIQRNCRVRLSRDGRVIYKGKVSSLRRMEDDAREVKAGFECGALLENFNDIKEGDQLELFKVDLVKRFLS